jgi:AhpC/TSA family
VSEVGCGDHFEALTGGGFTVNRFALCTAVALLAFMPAWGDDPPKDDKKEPTAKEQYQALVKDYAKQQNEILAEARKAKGEEQQKLFQKYSGLGKEFAGKFAKLAEDQPDDPVATDAWFWIMQNAAGSKEFRDASKKVTALIGEMPIKELKAKLNTIRGASTDIVTAVVKRAEKDDAESQAVDLLGWAATNGPFMPAGQKATKLLIEKDPDHKSIEQLCTILSRGYRSQSVDLLKKVLEKSSKESNKAAAALALGKSLYLRTDALGDQPEAGDKVAAEAEKYLLQVIEEFGKKNAAKRTEAEKELHSLRTLRVGKEAPQIAAGDLDGTEFKLSDYRGKVVLLDFWGHW